MANKIQIRRDTAANWTRINPVLSDGEPGLEIDTNKVKYGNGSSTWTALSYGIGDQLKSGNAVVSLSSTGTVSIPSILPVTFVAYMDAAHFVGTPSPLDLTDLPWYYTITFAVNAVSYTHLTLPTILRV